MPPLSVRAGASVAWRGVAWRVCCKSLNTQSESQSATNCVGTAYGCTHTHCSSSTIAGLRTRTIFSRRICYASICCPAAGALLAQSFLVRRLRWRRQHSAASPTPLACRRRRERARASLFAIPAKPREPIYFKSKLISFFLCWCERVPRSSCS